MSEIAKAKPLPNLDSTTLTAADTFRETFSHDDEEYGINPAIAVNNVSTTSAPKAPQEKKRTGWIVAGALVIFILGLSIGLATRNNGKESTAASAVAVPSQPSVPTEDSTSEVTVAEPSKPIVPTIVLDVEGALSISSDDTNSEDPIFEPEESVGDSALLNPSLPEIIMASTSSTSSTTSSSSANKPVLSEPIINTVIASPTMSPTPSPSVSPTKEPSSEPTSEPSAEPTKKVRMSYHYKKKIDIYLFFLMYQIITQNITANRSSIKLSYVKANI